MSKARQAADRAFMAGRKNLLINGCFRIAQRGASGSANGAYALDRWVPRNVSVSGGTHTWNYNSDLLNGTYLSCTLTGLTNHTYYAQKIEDVRTAAGKSVTISFEANNDVAAHMQVSVGQFFGTGGTPSAFNEIPSSLFPVEGGNVWKRYTVTLDVPTLDGKTVGTNGNDSLYVLLYIMNSAKGAPPDGKYRFRKVQCEINDVATEFEHRPIGEELALCQRYYQIFGIYRSGAIAMSTSGIESDIISQMRAQPSVVSKTVGSLVNATGAELVPQTNGYEIAHYPTGGTSGAATRYRIEAGLDAEL